MGLKNLHQVEAALRAKLKAVGNVSRERLYESGEMLKAWSVEVAPFKTGDLRGSATVTDKSEVIETGVCRVSYNSPYALYLHEIEPDFQNPTTPGTHSKYVERPLTEHQDDIVNHIIGGVKEELGS